MTERYRFTTTADGDLAVGLDPGELAARRERLVGAPWTWLNQVHGADVIVVDHPGQHAGARADGAVTAVPGAVVAVHTADCGPVVLLADGAVGVAHAGWRGLAGGVVGVAVDVLRSCSSGPITAVLGPCIRPPCYRFGVEDLDEVARAVGDDVRARTAAGEPALDLAAGITAALRSSGVEEVIDAGTCTACSPVHHSYRARRDLGRQAALAWVDA